MDFERRIIVNISKKIMHIYIILKMCYNCNISLLCL